MQPRNRAPRLCPFPRLAESAGRLFLDSRAAAFLGGHARYSRSGAACTWKLDYAVMPWVGIKATRCGAAQHDDEDWAPIPDGTKKSLRHSRARATEIAGTWFALFVPPLDKPAAASPATRVALVRRLDAIRRSLVRSWRNLIIFNERDSLRIIMRFRTKQN